MEIKSNRAARFEHSGEIAIWKIERRSAPGKKKRKITLGRGSDIDVLVLDVADQGDNGELFISYEV